MYYAFQRHFWTLPWLLIVFGMGGFFSKLHAQDPHFSQYYAAPLYLNPALTGLEKDIMIGLNYRTQWKSIDLPYVSSQFSVLCPIYKKGVQYKHKGGLGATLFNDATGESGGFKTFGMQISGAYNVALPLDIRHSISIGAQAGFFQKNLNLNNLKWGSQYHPIIGFDANVNPSVGDISEQATFPVLNTGIVWAYHADKNNYVRSGFKAFLGMAASNLNRPDESLFKNGKSHLPILYKLHGGLDYKIVHGVKFSPNLLVMQQNHLRQYNVGAYFTLDLATNPYTQQANYTKMVVGTWHRFNDAMIFVVGLTTKNITAGISFDLNSSTLRYQTRGRGAFEVSAAYRINRGDGLRRLSTPLM